MGLQKHVTLKRTKLLKQPNNLHIIFIGSIDLPKSGRATCLIAHIC